MTPACAWHDEAYINNKLHGGEKLRREMDQAFYKKMLKIADKKKSAILNLQAKIYYLLARGFGWIPWYFKKGNGK